MKSLWIMSGLLSLTSTLEAAVIDLQNAADGSDSITMSPGQPSDVQLVITMFASDTIPVSFVNAFLDTDNDLAKVSGVAGVQDWTYDRTSFTLPAELSNDGGNEYALVCGDSDGGDALPITSGTYVIDVLTLTTDSISGSTAVTFETGARTPQVFGPAPEYDPYFFCMEFCPGVPNLLLPGDFSGSNSPFMIHYVPEPVFGLFILAGLLIIPRRFSKD